VVTGPQTSHLNSCSVVMRPVPCISGSSYQWFVVSAVRRPHFAIEARRRFGVRIVNSPTCSLFTLPCRWAA
jgi:hypothetical protein